MINSNYSVLKVAIFISVLLLSFVTLNMIGFSNLMWLHYAIAAFLVVYFFMLMIIPNALSNVKTAPYFFLTPAMFLFMIFVIIPIIMSFTLSLYESDGSYKEWVGLANYRELMGDYIFHRALINNALWLIFFLLAPVFGLLLALFLNQEIKGIRLAKTLFFFPFVISLVVVGMVYTWFFNPDYGLLFKLIGNFLPSNFEILGDERFATFGIIFAALWPQTAYCLIIYLAGLSALNGEQIEAAKIDGAKGFSMFKHIIFPQLAPATFIAIVVTIIGALRSFDIIAIMTNGGPYNSSQVLSLYVYQKSIDEYLEGYGSAVAVVLFAIMMIFITFFIRHMIKQEQRS